MTPDELKQIGDLAELGMEVARIKGELEAVKSERDYLRSVLSAARYALPFQTECFHYFDMSQTAPTCRKCGAIYQPLRPSVMS